MSAATSRAWVDFRALRAQLDFRKVLLHYGVEIKDGGKKQKLCYCPLPSHKGKRKSPSFSINFEKGIWQCFGCSAKGNILDFAARMEGLDPFRGGSIRTVALKLMNVFGLNADGQRPSASAHSPPTAKSTVNPLPDAVPKLPVVVNAPLDFALKDLDAEHPYLDKRGFTPVTVKQFGLGFCNRGMFRGRIAIPIRDDEGRLVAYAGRVIDDRAITETNSKYKLPPPRERDGKLYEFHKSVVVYNLSEISEKVSDIVVVEGFPSVWWLWQNEWPNTVAVMGSECSEAQAKLIVSKVDLDGRVWALTDGDEAGERCAMSIVQRVAQYRFVRWVRLKDGEQPTDCSSEELLAMLSV